VQSIAQRKRRNRTPVRVTLTATLLATACVAASADTGKLLLTGGVSTVEGAAGGGISPWAVIGSNATAGEYGLSANASRLNTQDFDLTTYGLAVGINERVELSYAQQDLNASSTYGVISTVVPTITAGQHLKMDVLGAKVRLVGDAVLDSDSLMPQISAGLLYKSTSAGSYSAVISALGAKTSGTDVYLAATKLFLANSILLNGTLRMTEANQGGLLGFGANGEQKYQLVPELSVAYLLRKDFALGAEYRVMPNNYQNSIAPGYLHSDDWQDLFVAWAPGKNFSLTAAYVNLGQVVPVANAFRKQEGLYVSAQVAF
jgi:hypothetical protein